MMTWFRCKRLCAITFVAAIVQPGQTQAWPVGNVLHKPQSSVSLASSTLAVITDETTGVRIGIPSSLNLVSSKTKYGRNWRSQDNRLNIDTWGSKAAKKPKRRPLGKLPLPSDRRS
jgi:hypothetical protein